MVEPFRCYWPWPRRTVRCQAPDMSAFPARRRCGRRSDLLVRARDSDEDAEVLVAREAMVGSGRDERGLALPHLDRLTLDHQDAAALEHVVELVVGMRLLAVRLRRDENVDADLEPRRLVDDLVAAARLLESAPGRFDSDRVHTPA